MKISPIRPQEVTGLLFENEYGTIEISNDALSGIISIAANNCFGVHSMANKNMGESIAQLLKLDSKKKGITIDIKDDVVNITLRIIVRHGINISAIGNSIIGEVKYNVERMAGVKVGRVDVYVDSIMAD